MTNRAYQSIFSAPFSRRTFCRGAALFAAGMAAPSVFAAEPEKTEVTIAVGGKNLYYYLPAAIAEWKGFYKEEGLNVKVVDFQGGSKSLQAVAAPPTWFRALLSTRSRCRRSVRRCAPSCSRAAPRSASSP